jgi:hypothetical protein
MNTAPQLPPFETVYPDNLAPAIRYVECTIDDLHFCLDHSEWPSAQLMRDWLQRLQATARVLERQPAPPAEPDLQLKFDF